MSPRSVWRVAVEAVSHFNQDDGWAYSGYIAFAVLLALFPFLIFAVSLTAFLVGEGGGQAVVEYLASFAYDNIVGAIEPVIAEVLDNRRGGVLTVSAAAAVWASSSGIESFRKAFDRAYDVVVQRHFLINRLIAIGFVLVGALTFSVLSVVIVAAPLAFHLLETYAGLVIPNGAGLIRYGIGLSMLLLFLYLLHRILPSRPGQRRVIWPGILVTLILWMGGATGFSVYLSYAPSYTVTYGALAGAVITLLFLYLTGVLIIFGAQVNGALMRLREGKAQ